MGMLTVKCWCGQEASVMTFVRDISEAPMAIGALLRLARPDGVITYTDEGLLWECSPECHAAREWECHAAREWEGET